MGQHAPILFDIAIPELKLIIEYHGRMHYQEVFKSDQVRALQARDAVKIDLCKANNFTLIIIPYWWNKKWETLASEIEQQRPDLAAIFSQSGP